MMNETNLPEDTHLTPSEQLADNVRRLELQLELTREKQKSRALTMMAHRRKMAAMGYTENNFDSEEFPAVYASDMSA